MSDSSTNTLGKYQIIREIARSNDIVYEAIDPSINRRVAIKELSIPPNLQGAGRRERIERFWREGKAAGRLSHPNIVTVFEVGKDGDRHFIAMEYLEGQTLRDTIQSAGPMSITTVKDFSLQLCSALSYAHRNGVIHRDIKPENVQILPGGHIKLTDFGIARLVGEPSITQDGQVFGTPSYMSPEQVAGKDLDTRSDIFSLGVLMYEMVAGKKPFAGDSIVTITYNIVNMEAPPPPGAPPWLVSVIRKGMTKDPEMRYQSVDDVAEDLRNETGPGGLAVDPNNISIYPSPFGGAAQPPQQQQPSVPITPYGTPMPSPGAGAPSGSAPDPFAQGPQPSVLSAPLPPPRAAMSAETRNFLGVLLLTLALAGMLVFAIWAVNLAYSSYVTAQTSGIATRYYEQGRKLQERGDYPGAEEQYTHAIRVSPKSKAGENARTAVFVIWAFRARAFADARDKDALMELGRKMVEAKRDAPEGHFYVGVAHQLSGDYAAAIAEYGTTSTLAGNDEAGYGRAARARSEQLQALQQQQAPPQPSNDGGAPPAPTPEPNPSPIPYERGSQ